MSYMKNTIDGEFTEKVVKNNPVKGYKGLIAVAAVGGLMYVIGNRRGFNEGVDTYSRQMKAYLEGTLAGVEIAMNRDDDTTGGA